MLGQIVGRTPFVYVIVSNNTCSFRIMITGANSGLIETISDAVSIHSIKKAEYAKRLAEGKFGYVTLMDHFTSVSCMTLFSKACAYDRSQDIRRPYISKICQGPEKLC